VFELALIEKLEFFVELMGTKIVKVSLLKLGLSPALNNAFDMRIDLTFLGDSLNAQNTQVAIENASMSYAEKQDFEVSIAGPIHIAKAGFASSITENFRYLASFKDTMSYIYSHSENADSLTMSSLLDNSNMSISILNDRIDAFLGIQVPGLSSLKPPLNYSFPFFVGFDLYGAQEKVLQTKISPIILKKDPKGFGIHANASVIPVNTQEAAAGLASVVNPILSRSPKVFLFSLVFKLSSSNSLIIIRQLCSPPKLALKIYSCQSMAQHHSCGVRRCLVNEFCHLA
jgi:hypothetical protein